MKEYSETAWKIASLYSKVLASETRDLAAHIDAAIDAERQRCADIISAARFDEVDRDWRAIGHMINGGRTVEQIKDVGA